MVKLATWTNTATKLGINYIPTITKMDITAHHTLALVDYELDKEYIVNYSDCTCYYLNGKLHREGGPAIEYEDKNRNEYYLFGIRYYPNKKQLARNRIVSIYNETNYFDNTRTVFSRCDKPIRQPDFVSKSGSQYWYFQSGVIRYSDHWGSVASCLWILWTKDRKEWAAGYSNWDNFTHYIKK